MFNFFTAESDFRRQNLTSKVDPRTERDDSCAASSGVMLSKFVDVYFYTNQADLDLKY